MLNWKQLAAGLSTLVLLGTAPISSAQTEEKKLCQLVSLQKCPETATCINDLQAFLTQYDGVKRKYEPDNFYDGEKDDEATFREIGWNMIDRLLEYPPKGEKSVENRRSVGDSTARLMYSCSDIDGDWAISRKDDVNGDNKITLEDKTLYEKQQSEKLKRL